MRFMSRSRVFANHYLELHRVSAQVHEPVPGVELRRMKTGVEFYIDHFQKVILIRFPGTTDWFDFLAIKKLGSIEVLQSQLQTTLPESRLSQVNKLLKFRGKGAE